MYSRLSAELVSTAIYFRPGHILVDSAAEDTAELFRIIVRPLDWKEAEMSTFTGDDTRGTYGDGVVF